MISLTVGGLSYSYPQTGDTNWGTGATGWAQAVTSDMLSISGGTYALTADLNLGSNFGLVALYYKSVSSNISGSGVIRLAVGDLVSWRNNANSGDVPLGIDASNNLAFNSNSFVSAAGILLADAYPATTGDVTSVAGALATTVAKIQGKTVSGTTGTGNVVFSASPTFTGTAVFASLTASTPLAIAYGGTGQATASAAFNALSPMTTAGDMIIGGVSGAATRVGIGSNNFVWTVVSGSLGWAAAGSGTVTSVTFTGDGTVLSSTPSSAVTTTGTVTGALKTQTKNTALFGPTSGSVATPTFRVPVYADLSPGFTAPTVQKFLSTGTTTGYVFTISTSTTCAVGDTYTDSSAHTYTVLGALSAQSGQVLFMSGTPTPAGTTLSRATGSGTSSITFSAFQALGTYTTPSSPAPLYVRIRVVGGGGGGGAGNVGAPQSNGGAGGPSVFGSNLLFAGGGGGGVYAGGAGGTATQSASPGGIALVGGWGSGGQSQATAVANFMSGGAGASGPFGGGGGGGPGNQSAAGNAAPNTGAGGGGGGGIASSSMQSAGGGGAGGYVDALISSPASTYPYAVGGGGGGQTGTSTNGGSGGSGVVIVEEFYQ